jgi:hypothetical protein
MHDNQYTEQLSFFFYFYLNDPGISWDCKLWSQSVSSAKVRNAASCCSFWVQDIFVEAQTHSTGTYFRLILKTTFLKMTLLPKVTMLLRYWIDNTESEPFSAHVILHLQIVRGLIYYCSHRSWPKRETERLSIHTRAVLYVLLGKHNEIK